MTVIGPVRVKTLLIFLHANVVGLDDLSRRDLRIFDISGGCGFMSLNMDIDVVVYDLTEAED